MEYKKDCPAPSRVDSHMADQRHYQNHYARQFVRDKVVLDLGCAAGRGLSVLAQVARKVLALDGLEESKSIDFAKQSCPTESRVCNVF